MLLALFATHPLVLLACSLLQLAPPGGLPSLATRPTWVYWMLVAAWLLASVLLALAVRTPWRLWRWAVGSLALLLVIAAVSGLLARLPLAWPMAWSMLAMAGLLVWLAVAIHPRERDARQASTRGAAHGAASPQAWHRDLRGALRPHLQRHAGFWVCGVLMLLFFEQALSARSDPQRGVGMLGMLLVFFVVLPGVTLAAWMPRLARWLCTVAALGLAGLAWRSGLALPGWGAPALLLLAWGPVLRVALASRMSRPEGA